MVLETAVDDLNPQVIAYVTAQALQLGALDVMCTPVLMKKGRPGTMITVLTDRSTRRRLEELLFRETSTLGLRIREENADAASSARSKRSRRLGARCASRPD